MSADMTSQEDLDDIAFRALLEPLALEVLPGRLPHPAAEPANPAELEARTSSDGQPPPAGIPAGLEITGPDVTGPNVNGQDAPGLDASGPDAAVSVVRSEARPALAEVAPDPAAQTSAAVADGKSPLQDHSPPAIARTHLATPGSERLSEDWWAPPSAPVDLPAVPSAEGQEMARTPPPPGQFASSPARVFPEGKWRLTVALPDQPGRLRPPPDGAVARRTPSPAHPTFSTSELGPYRSTATALAAGATRPAGGPRLIARAGAAQRAMALPDGATHLVMRRPVLPPARVRWSVVLLAGLASAVSVACLSWLFDPTAPGEAPRMTDSAVQENAGSAAVPNAAPAHPSDAPQAASHGVTPVPAPAAPSATPPQAMIGLLTQRGDAALAVGDIIAARLLYERAAGMGSATAATAAGKTYDLDFLLRADTHGIRPDSAAAATWYRKAVALGDPSARTLLARLGAQSEP